MAEITTKEAIELLTIIDDSFDTYNVSGMEKLGILATMAYNILRSAEIRGVEEDEDDLLS